MRKLVNKVAELEGLKKKTDIAQVREILSLVAKILGTESALNDIGIYGQFIKEFTLAEIKAHKKARSILDKNTYIKLDELLRKVCKR